ncbi:MAG: T9SS type B sorting domain-containing protein, partial [Ferruginibacter sp.]|nr:T9SS type B sorting domain-containing protein [Ferruginibacter sp.]
VVGPGGCISVAEKKILVKGPSGNFTYGGLSGCAPYTINLKATTKGTKSYVWDYNDGNAMVSSNLNPSHSYDRAGTYIPKLILKDSAGCIVSVIGKDTVRVYDVQAGMNMSSLTVCDQGKVSFSSAISTNDVVKSFSWNFGNDSTSTIQNPSFYFTKKGIYYPSLSVITVQGCKDTFVSKTPIKVAASPVGQITQTANGCVNLTVIFRGRLLSSDTAAMSWKWNFGNENISNSIDPEPQLYRIAGNYKVNLLITSSLGCMDTVSTNVEAYAIPNINAGTDTTVCRGTGKTLLATGATTYSWFPSKGLSCTDCPNPVANPDSAISYVVTGKSIYGCMKKDTINVSVKYPFSMRTVNGDTLCKGESMRLFASGAERYSWTPSEGLDNPNSGSPMATPFHTTLYRVIGSDDKSCFTDTGYVPLVVYDIPTVDAGLDKTINVGQIIELTPKVSPDVIDAKWSPSGQAFRSVFPNLTIKPRETTTYRVDVFNQGGCTSFDEITINVLCDGANIFIPNTFSPNGDGMNDVFYPRGTGLFSIKRLKIFNRWGEVMFEKNDFLANDANKGWDGSFKGTKLNADVFVYVAEVVCDNNSVLTFKGNVALIK